MLPAQLNALDPHALAQLKRQARDGNSPEALRATAKQFEGLFLQMVLKSMRAAVPSNGLLDNDQTRLFQSLQDQQMATNLAQGRGVGLADVIYRQLGGDKVEAGKAGAAAGPNAPGAPVGTGGTKGAGDAANALAAGLSVPPRTAGFAAGRYRTAISAGSESAASAADPSHTALDTSIGAAFARRVDVAREAAGADKAGVTGSPAKSGTVSSRARDFVERVWDHAREASEATGIPARFMVAQAALETGWGRAELRRADGQPSYNLFNIKAGANWKGPVVEVPVTEYANGRKYTEVARFRAYGSYEEAFRDYANLLSESPRYAGVLGETDPNAFARGLQRAGYATDPMYADKLARIIDGRTMRAALSA